MYISTDLFFVRVKLNRNTTAATTTKACTGIPRVIQYTSIPFYKHGLNLIPACARQLILYAFK